MLTMLPYNSLQSYCANTNLYLNLIQQHADGLKSTKLKQQTASMHQNNLAYYIAVIYDTYFQMYFYLLLCYH